MSTVIYNCRHCQVGRRVEYPERSPTGKVYRVTLVRGCRVFAGEAPDVSCPKCARPMRFGELRGTFNAAIRCNAVCEFARGASCSCSCGGRNHGAGWSGAA